MRHNLRSLYKVCIEHEYISKKTTYKEFYVLVREYHKELSQKILRGYAYKPLNLFGTFHIVKDVRRGKTIDWGTSNKLKESIIARGGTPLSGKRGTPECNNGEEWLVYYEDSNYYKWKWFKQIPLNIVTNLKYFTNLRFYIFKPCTRNRRTIAQVIKEDDLMTENYGVYK